MPFNPGVYDQSGQILGNGILGAFQSFSQGLEKYQQRKEENKRLESENKALELITKSSAGKVGLPPEMVDQLTIASPDETPMARNARLKTALHGVLTQQQIEEEQQRQAMAKAQMAELQRRATVDTRNQAAAQAAVAPQLPAPAEVDTAFNSNGAVPVPTAGAEPTGDEMMRRYIAAGGNDRNQADMLIAAAKPKKEARKLETITLKDETGKPVSFAWDGASAPQRISKEPVAAKPLSGPGKLMADAAMYEQGGDGETAKLLRTIAAKQAEDKPMDVTAFLMLGGKIEDYVKYETAFKAARAKVGANPPTGAGSDTSTGPKFDAALEGKRVIGPDKKNYIIKNGAPVLVK